MTGGQVLQVFLSLAVVGFALYLATRVARRKFGTTGAPVMKVVSRQSIERGQNLVVVEVDGNQHLIALTNGGAATVDTWEAPEATEASQGQAERKSLLPRFAGTQWTGLGKQASIADVLTASPMPETPKWPQPQVSRPTPDQLSAPSKPAGSAAGELVHGKGFAAKLAAAENNAGPARPQSQPQAGTAEGSFLK